MDIFIRNTGDVPIYEQLTRQIQGAILKGELAPGEALPSIRGLAKDLRISVITTKRAYEELEKDGFIVTVPGKGSFVAGQDTQLIRETRLRQAEEALGAAVANARDCGLSLPQLIELVTLLYKEEEP